MSKPRLTFRTLWYSGASAPVETRPRAGAIAVRIEARAGRVVAGAITVDTRSMAVSFIETARPFQRQGIGTRLYEKAAALTCAQFKRPLRSDYERTKNSDTFWQKQVAKGRATCEQAIERDDADDWAHEGRSGCERYKLTCPAPADLSGRRSGTARRAPRRSLRSRAR